MKLEKARSHYLADLLTPLPEQERDDVIADLAELNACLHDANLRTVLHSPLVTTEAKLHLIEEGGMKSYALLKPFLASLLDEDAIQSLEQITRGARRILHDQTGQEDVSVTSPHGISEAQRAELTEKMQKMLGATKLHFTEKTDPDMLSGVRVQVEDTVIDFSSRSQLTRIRQAF